MTTFVASDYEGIRAGCQRSAGIIVPLLLRKYLPRQVLDVGCGEGWFAQRFVDSGVPSVGVDLERPAVCPLAVFLEHDLAEPLSAGLLTDRDALVLCLEVAEHLPAERGPALVAELCEAAPVVVFSAAIPGQGGHGHMNERWQSYWAELFAEHSRHPDTAIRDTIWSDERVEPWYRQNLVVYSEHTTKHGPLDVVHPEIYGWRLAELAAERARPAATPRAALGPRVIPQPQRPLSKRAELFSQLRERGQQAQEQRLREEAERK